LPSLDTRDAGAPLPSEMNGYVSPYELHNVP
jgi:hypothetical protein